MRPTTIISLILLCTLALGACGTAAPSEPAISPEQIQSTAVAAALTIVAETQAAIPTNTPLPPTDTPAPTPIATDTSLPTLDALVIPTFTSAPQAAAGNTDPCNQPLPDKVAGTDTKIKLVNTTKGDLVVSLYLNKTAFGECGYRGYNIGPKESITITDLPQGCYNISVFVNDPKKPSKAFGYGCINNPDLWAFQISEDKAILVSP